MDFLPEFDLDEPEIIEEDAGLASNFQPSKESREVLEKSGVRALGK